MSRVIKAGLTRMMPKQERIVSEEQPEHIADTESEASPADIPQDVQAAYDELIEAATNEVSYMLEDARREAQSLRNEALEQTERVMEEARERGYAEGVPQGRAAGLEEVRAGFRELFEEGERSLEALREELRGRLEARLDGMRDDILRLSLDIASKIIGQTIEQDADAFASLVKTALDAVKADTNLSVRLNPNEFLARFQERDSIQAARRDTAVQVSPDPSVPPGGCWIDTESGVADASVDAQLEQIAYHMGLLPDTNLNG